MLGSDGALHRPDVTTLNIDTVKGLVEGIPDMLSFKNEEDQLPIQICNLQQFY